MREGLFMLGASCGIDSPSKFSHRHIAMRESNNNVNKVEEFVSPAVRIKAVEELSRQTEEKKELIGS